MQVPGVGNGESLGNKVRDAWEGEGLGKRSDLGLESKLSYCNSNPWDNLLAYPAGTITHLVLWTFFYFCFLGFYFSIYL